MWMPGPNSAPLAYIESPLPTECPLVHMGSSSSEDTMAVSKMGSPFLTDPTGVCATCLIPSSAHRVASHAHFCVTRGIITMLLLPSHLYRTTSTLQWIWTVLLLLDRFFLNFRYVFVRVLNWYRHLRNSDIWHSHEHTWCLCSCRPYYMRILPQTHKNLGDSPAPHSKACPDSSGLVHSPCLHTSSFPECHRVQVKKFTAFS